MYSNFKAVYLIVYLFTKNLIEGAVIIENVISEEDVGDNPGLPLFLTPYIEQNKIDRGQNAAEVQFNGFKQLKSYSGYLTVNKQYNSNLFFWYFPAQTNNASAPVVLWLQGGPGDTSLIGLFSENGPFSVKSKHGLEMRKFAWTQTHNMVYFDNPVGAGYSFTDDGGYAQNETAVSNDLYNALVQFFTLFPDLQSKDFYVAGEAYAGKFVPSIAYAIHKNNPTAKLKINLKGLSIGNGFSDPEHQVNYGDFLYQIGLIDFNIQETYHQQEQQIITAIQNKKWSDAFQLFDNFITGYTSESTLFKNTTGFSYNCNFLLSVQTDAELSYMMKYIQRNDVRAAIHVGNATFNDGHHVVTNLQEDILQTVAPLISELLSNYRVLIYNGQLDILFPYSLMINYLKNLQFDAADQYKKAIRQQWYVGNDLAGYVKTAGNLTEVLVRDAGHLVPRDQPQWTFDLFSRFTQNKLFSKKNGLY